MFEMKDSTSGDTYQYRYVVPMNNPERLEFRNLDKIENPNADDNWRVWPDDMPWPSEVAEHFHGNLVMEFDVPTFFVAFSEIRAAAQTLKQVRSSYSLGDPNFNQLKTAIANVIRVVDIFGDLDENYESIAKDALNGNDIARAQLRSLIEK